MFSETWKLLFSIGMALVVQFGGVVWVASGINLKTEQNEKDLRELKRETTDSEKRNIVARTKTKIIERKLERMEDLLFKIWEKVK